MTIKNPPHPGPGISPRMAIRLDKAFGGADTWYRLQPPGELAQAKKVAHHIKVERLAPAT